jgi:hypothetical protein
MLCCASSSPLLAAGLEERGEWSEWHVQREKRKFTRLVARGEHTGKAARRVRAVGAQACVQAHGCQLGRQLG